MDQNINVNIEARENEKIYYPGTKIERPVELTGGGRGDYCCLSVCKNDRYNHLYEATQIGLFRFPIKGLELMKNVRRKGKNDRFTPDKRSSLVFEFHFEITDIKVQNEKT